MIMARVAVVPAKAPQPVAAKRGARREPPRSRRRKRLPRQLLRLPWQLPRRLPWRLRRRLRSGRAIGREARHATARHANLADPPSARRAAREGGAPCARRASDHEAKLLAERAFQSGLEHMKSGRYQSASAELQRAVQLLPSSFEYRLYEKWCALRGRGEPPHAVDLAELRRLSTSALANDPEPRVRLLRRRRDRARRGPRQAGLPHAEARGEARPRPPRGATAAARAGAAPRDGEGVAPLGVSERRVALACIEWATRRADSSSSSACAVRVAPGASRFAPRT